MGRAKEQWMRQCDEGWQSAGNKQVCSKCVSDQSIQRFIQDKATATRCSYCGRRSKKPCAVHADKVFSFIAQGLKREYEDPAENVGFESREGGYLMSTYDTQELLVDHGLGDSQEDFWEDLCDAFAQTEWVDRDPYGMRPDEEMITIWDRFCHQVQHETRFVFFRVSVDLSSEIGIGTPLQPYDVLRNLSSIARELDLITTLPSGTKLVRARQHRNKERPRKVGEIAPLPAKHSHQQNRFSPAGIPMFYGAEDRKTAFLEVAFPQERLRNQISYGVFETSRDLVLLDLTDLHRQPSLFDPDRASLRASISFLQHFIESARKPAQPGASSVAYVPTQVVAEYFRHVFQLPRGRRLDGIRYQSSKEGAGVCFTLFFDAEECGEKHETEKPLMLKSLKMSPLAEERKKHSPRQRGKRK